MRLLCQYLYFYPDIFLCIDAVSIMNGSFSSPGFYFNTAGLYSVSLKIFLNYLSTVESQVLCGSDCRFGAIQGKKVFVIAHGDNAPMIISVGVAMEADLIVGI